ncbi:extensin-3 [Drosophila guanche]|nr:extensin-3 [Drosophila guanche]
MHLARRLQCAGIQLGTRNGDWEAIENIMQRGPKGVMKTLSAIWGEASLIYNARLTCHNRVIREQTVDEISMNTQIILLCLAASLALALARPEPPRSRYGPPAPQQEYGPPPPAQPLPAYGPPAAFYGPPAAPATEAIVTKNVYVHVPPEEPEFYPAASPIQTAVPKKHYKIIFIKAPNPPTPVRQVLPPPVQDEHKTLVYVLVKKPEEQLPVILPSPAPTEPSKPEVYFIKYKQQQQKPAPQYGPPAAPAEEYGAPPAPRGLEQF